MARIRGRSRPTHTGPVAGTGTGSGGTAYFVRSVTISGTTYSWQLYVPTGYTASLNWPLILNFEGDATRGSNNTGQLAQLYTQVQAAPANFPCLIAFVQCPSSGGALVFTDLPAEYALIPAIIKSTASEWSVDRRRISMAGFSRGGLTATAMLKAYPKLFAAFLGCSTLADPGTLAPYVVSSVSPNTTACAATLVAASVPTLPIRMYWGDSDTTLPTLYTPQTMAQIKGDFDTAFAGNPNYSSTMIVGGVHGTPATTAYADATVIAWLLSQTTK